MPLTAAELIDTIKTLTTKIRSLQGPANSISNANAPLITIGQGPFPIIIGGLNDINATLIAAAEQINGGSPYTDKSDEKKILEEFDIYVMVAQQFLNILIGKSSVLSVAPFVGPPVAAALRGHEGAFDTFSFTLIDASPNISSDLTTKRDALSKTLNTAIDVYSPMA